MEYKTGVKVEGGLVTLPEHGRAIIVGDLHSKIENLEEILKKTGFEKNAEKDDLYLVFLGDYADRREEKNLETIERVFNLKNRFKDRVVTLAGNHEHVDKEGKISISSFQHHLPLELRMRFGEEKGGEFYGQVKSLYENLPIAVKAGRVLMVHGGIPHPDVFNGIDDYKKPSEELKLQTVWNEPKEKADGFKPSDRGSGVWVFGKNAVESFLKKHDFDMVVSGHTHKNENLWNRAYTIDSSGVHGANPSYVELDLGGLNKKSSVYTGLKRVELDRRGFELPIEEQLSREIENQKGSDWKYRAVDEEVDENVFEKTSKEPLYTFNAEVIGRDAKEGHSKTFHVTEKALEKGIVLGRYDKEILENGSDKGKYFAVTSENDDEKEGIASISREHVSIKKKPGYEGILVITHHGKNPTRVTRKNVGYLNILGKKDQTIQIKQDEIESLILGGEKSRNKIKVTLSKT